MKTNDTASFVQAVLSVFHDDGWYPIRNVIIHPKNRYYSPDVPMDAHHAVQFIRRKTTIRGEALDTHFPSQQPTFTAKAVYHLTPTGRERLEAFLMQVKRGVTDLNQHKMVNFFSLNANGCFSVQDLSMNIFDGKKSNHAITTIIRRLRENAYIIDDMTDPQNGRNKLYQYNHYDAALGALSLDDVLEEFLAIGKSQNGVLSVADVCERCARVRKNRYVANKLLRNFSLRLKANFPGSCRKETNKAYKCVTDKVKFDVNIPLDKLMHVKNSEVHIAPRHVLPLKYIIANGGSVDNCDLVAFIRAHSGWKANGAAPLVADMVTQGFVKKEYKEYITKRGRKKRYVSRVSIADDFPFDNLDAMDKAVEPVSISVLPDDNAVVPCTTHYGYLARDVSSHPVKNFKMWVRKITNGQAGERLVTIRAMSGHKASWSYQLAKEITLPTIELAKAVCYLLECEADLPIDHPVRLGTPESQTVLNLAMEHGFVPHLLTLPEHQRGAQSIAWLHLPTQVFRILFVDHHIQDVSGLIRARENGGHMAGLGKRALEQIDDAILGFFPEMALEMAWASERLCA